MSRRTYRQNCALARAADLIGDRWTLLLIRDLALGPRRFGELQTSLEGVGSNLLAARLRELQAAGVIERRPPEGSDRGYSLTESGRALEPVLLALCRWGMVHGGERRPAYRHRDEWDLLALKALFHPEYARDLSFCVQFRSERFSGWVAVHGQQVRVGLGEAATKPDVVFDATVRELFTGSKPPAELCDAEALPAVQRFMSAFVLRV